MKKRILCIVLTLCMVLMLVPTTALAVEGKTVSFTVTADKTEAQPGDTITFTVTMGAVDGLGGLKLGLSIPEGLTYVPGSGTVAEGLKEKMSAESIAFYDMPYFWIPSCNYTSTADTVLTTFQCTVNDDAALGEKAVEVCLVEQSDCTDVDGKRIAATFTPATVEVYVESGKTTSITVTADKTEAQPGDTITFTITMGAVEKFCSLALGLRIPEGLTYVANSGTVPEGLKETMAAGELVFDEGMILFLAQGCDYTSNTDTVLMTFQCKVNDDAALGVKHVAVGLYHDDKRDCTDVDGKRIAATFTPATVTVFAESGKTTSFTVTADKTEAQPGDTITFTVTMGAVEKLRYLVLNLRIPEGLTYVENSGTVPEGLKATMSAGQLEFLDFFNVLTANGCDYTSNTDTVLMTFQCKVNDDAAPGDKTVAVGLWEDEKNFCLDVDGKRIAATFTPATVTVSAEDKVSILTVPMYRLYNPNSGEHFYTGSADERDNLEAAGWEYEGVAWNAPVSIGEPVYRMFNPNSGDHHYTMSQAEVDMLLGYGWQYENVAWNSAPQDHPDSVVQYRLYNPNADLGCHHYTGSVEEKDVLIGYGWQLEGIGWFGLTK